MDLPRGMAGTKAPFMIGLEPELSRMQMHFWSFDIENDRRNWCSSA